MTKDDLKELTAPDRMKRAQLAQAIAPEAWAELESEEHEPVRKASLKAARAALDVMEGEFYQWHEEQQEREQTVRWLREKAQQDPTPFNLDPMAALGLVLDCAASMIEQGEHIER